MNPLRLFIGLDSREPAAYHVLSHSILRRASRPVSITPLALNQLAPWLYTRERTSKESTEFSFTRFLVPYLSGYQGTSIFMDSDMLALVDLWEIREEITSGAAVCVCQHDYTPKNTTKFLGHEQATYPRKNWSSFIVFDNWRCRALTPEYVNTATGLQLHRFTWLEDREIGRLPLEWNYLVGEEHQAEVPPKIIHYTNAGPWFPGYEDVDFAKEWFAERDHMLACG
jgi:hypothetical protein